MESFVDEQFEKRDFRGQPLHKGEYENCTFTNCNFSGVNLSGYRFTVCIFTQCDLSIANIARTSLQNIQFKDCKLLGLRFDHCEPFGLSFSFDNCILDHSSFYQCKLPKTIIKGSQMKEVDLTECNLTGAIIEGCDLSQATFDNTILEKADLRTSVNYNIDPDRNRIRKAKFSLSEVAGLLGKYDITIDKTN